MAMAGRIVHADRAAGERSAAAPTLRARAAPWRLGSGAAQHGWLNAFNELRFCGARRHKTVAGAGPAPNLWRQVPLLGA